MRGGGAAGERLALVAIDSLAEVVLYRHMQFAFSASEEVGGRLPVRRFGQRERDRLRQDFDIFIACGDGNFYASGLTYSSYGGGVSRARGTLTQNTCTPACFDGSFVSRPGTIQLSHIAVCQGRFYYDEISWRFLQPSPFPANNTGRQNISPTACPPF